MNLSGQKHFGHSFGIRKTSFYCWYYLRIWLYTKASDDKEIKHESNSLALSLARDITIEIFATYLKEKEENIYTDGYCLNV